MAREQAEKVQRLLQEVAKEAVPLHDKELSRKIEQASEHIEKKLDKGNQ